MQTDRAPVSKAGVTTRVPGEGESQQGGRKAEDGEGCTEAEFRPVGAGRNQTAGSGIWNSLSKFRKGKLWMSKSSQVSPLSFPLLIQDQSSSCALLEGGFPGKARGRRQLGGTLESPLLWKVTVGQTHCLGLPHLFLPICCLLEAEGRAEGPEDRVCACHGNTRDTETPEARRCW